jgi:fatty acid desaturase
MSTVWTLCAVSAVVVGVAGRQIDRLWFSPRRVRGVRFSRDAPVGEINELLRLQRDRVNNVTPVIVSSCHWLEILGWAALCRVAPAVTLPLICVYAAVKFRHLQELTHFAVHGCLARGRRCNDVLGEVIFQAPLAMPSINRRRTTHVVEHHPNATDPRLDPNIAALYAAGLRPGCRDGEFVRALLFPLTVTGLRETVRQIRTDLATHRVVRSARWTPLVVIVLVTALGGAAGLVAVLLVPRLVVYPYLSWLSLLFEHRWFAVATPAASTDRRTREAERCIRLYRRRRVLEWIARGTWLPYGDLFHFAHSVYPSMRWNFLPVADRLLGDPRGAFSSTVWGRSSAVAALYEDSRTRPATGVPTATPAAGTPRRHSDAGSPVSR